MEWFVFLLQKGLFILRLVTMGIQPWIAFSSLLEQVLLAPFKVSK